MLTELFKHKHLGEIDNIVYVLRDVLSKKTAKSMTIADVKKYCSDKTINLIYQIDGILALLEFVEIISRSRSSIRLNRNLPKNWIKTTGNSLLAKTIIEKILINMKDESCLDDFIALERIRFDPTLNQITILNNLIPLQYSSIKNLLINLGGLKISPEYPSILIVDESLQIYFESTIIPWLKEAREKDAFSLSSSGLSLEKLLELLELKNQYGAQAEEYVLGFERNRLKDHPFQLLIRRISDIDVGAGYDIVSFENQESQSFDRFIEVKSFSKDEEFYWSKTEVRIAETKRKNYFLYLVDREKVGDSSYQPTIIQNPHETVFENSNWQKDPQNWLVKRLQVTSETVQSTETKVFVSYSHQNKLFVKKLVDELIVNGYKVWWDYSTLKGGEEWQQEIQKGINDCRYFIVVLTPDSVTSEWVGNEITLASQKRKIIIPLNLETCEIPISLIQKQRIDFKKQPRKTAYKELIGLLNIRDREILRP